MCYCFTVLVVHPSYVSHAEFCSLSHVVCSRTPDLCSLLLFTCICFHLLPVVISPLLFRQPCLLSSSPVFGSTSHCPVTQLPRPSVSPPLWSLLLRLDSSFLRYYLIVDCRDSPSLKVYPRHQEFRCPDPCPPVPDFRALVPDCRSFVPDLHSLRHGSVPNSIQRLIAVFNQQCLDVKLSLAAMPAFLKFLNNPKKKNLHCFKTMKTIHSRVSSGIHPCMLTLCFIISLAIRPHPAGTQHQPPTQPQPIIPSISTRLSTQSSTRLST